ncbi:MAG: O-antigen ligase family protein [Chloroflexota bacterium]|nr:O-antigen ligase family protein [Chloroflexota bacterium]
MLGSWQLSRKWNAGIHLRSFLLSAPLWAVPLAINPWGLNYELPKVVTLRALILLTAGVYLLKMAPRYRPLSLREWLRRPLVLPVLGFAGATLLSAFTSLDPLTSLLGGYHRQQGAYLTLLLVVWSFLLAEQLRSATERRRLSTALIITGTLVALTPFVESLYWHENPFTWRPGGSLGNPIFLGAYLIMVLPFTLARLLTVVDKRSQQIALSGALALQLLAVLVTQSRGPWIGALAGGALFVFLLLWPTHRRLVISGLVGGMLFLGLLLMGWKAEVAPVRYAVQLPYVNRLVKATDLSRGTTRVRIVLWKTALKVVRTWPAVGLDADRWHALRPLLGYGPDTAGYVYNTLYPPELAHIEDPGAIWDRAHNEVLDILTMRGWLGVATVAALGVALARRGFYLWRADPTVEQRAWLAAPLSALLAHAVEVQFAFTLTATAMLTWFCIGWLMAVGSASADPGKSRVLARRWQIYAVMGAFLLVASAVRVEGGALWADTLAGRARRLDSERHWEESLSCYDRAIKLIPWYAPYHQFRGETLFNLGRALPATEETVKAELFSAADRSLARARALNPLELEHYSNAGILHAAWAEFAPEHLSCAVAYYEQAFELSPTRVRLRVELGHIYYNFHHYEQALGQYKDAVAIDATYYPAYYGQGLVWQELGDLTQARAAFSRAWELNPHCVACEEAMDALAE